MHLTGFPSIHEQLELSSLNKSAVALHKYVYLRHTFVVKMSYEEPHKFAIKMSYE